MIYFFFLNLANVAFLEHRQEKMLESQVDLTLFEITSAIILKAPENGMKQLMWWLIKFVSHNCTSEFLIKDKRTEKESFEARIMTCEQLQFVPSQPTG